MIIKTLYKKLHDGTINIDDDVTLEIPDFINPVIVSADAMRYVHNEWQLARRRYTLNDSRDRAVGCFTLIAAGVSNASEHGVVRIQVPHIERGWFELALCPGNAPPHLCIKSSIIDREKDLLDREDLLGRLLRLADIE